MPNTFEPELKTAATPVPTPPVVPPETPKEDPNESVTITRGQLKGLLDRLESVENRGAVKKPKRVTEHTATIRMYKDQPVVLFDNVREKKDFERDKMVSFMDVTTADGVKHDSVNYLDFLNSVGDFAGNTADVLIKKQHAEEVVKSQGTRRTENTDPMHVKHFQSREVEMEVTSYVYKADIEILSGALKGSTFTVPNLCLNA